MQRGLFLVDKCKEEMIYCCFIYSPSISPLSSPPHLHHCTEGRFFNFLHENNAIAFLASPAKQAPATHGDRWPPIIAECLIDPGRARRRAPVFACLRASVRVASHILHACNVCRSQVNAFPPPVHPDACLPACWPWGSLDEWLSLHICTLPHTRRCN